MRGWGELPHGRAWEMVQALPRSAGGLLAASCQTKGGGGGCFFFF